MRDKHYLDSIQQRAAVKNLEAQSANSMRQPRRGGIVQTMIAHILSFSQWFKTKLLRR